MTLILTGVLTLPVFAGDVTIKSRNLDGANNETGRTTLYFTSDKLLIENQFKNDNQALIFSNSRNEFILIDHTRREYYQVTEAELRQFIGQLRQTIPMMKAFMSNMPPEQQEKLKKQFGSLLGEEAPPTTFSKTGSNIKVKSWSTDKYEATVAGDKVADMYLASYSKLGVSKEDFNSFEGMRRIFGEVIGEFAGVLPLGPSIKGLATNLDDNPAFEEGVPVRSVTYSDGASTGENITESVTTGTISADKFNIPTGYARKQLKMPEMR